MRTNNKLTREKTLPVSEDVKVATIEDDPAQTELVALSYPWSGCTIDKNVWGQIR